MLVVLVDVNGKGIGGTNMLEIVGLREIEVESFHCGNPCAPLAVMADGVGTGISQLVMVIVAQLTCGGV